MNRLAACLTLLLAPAALAQVPDASGMGGAGLGGLGGLGGADLSGLGSGAGEAPRVPRAQLGAGASSAGPQAGAGVSNPDNLFGLKPSASPRMLSLQDAMRMAVEANIDLRIAREKVIQQEAGVRRAWSALLPNASLSGAYTYNCTFLRNPAEGDYAFCGDLTIDSGFGAGGEQFGLLFTSLGDILAQAAEFEDDPVRKEELQQQAQDLRDQGDVLAEPGEPIVVQPAQVVTGRMTVTMPLFNGRAFPLLQNAYAAVDAVNYAGSQAQRALMLAVARAYYSAVTAKKLVGIAAQQRDSAARQRDAAKARVEVNAATPLSLRRAELDLIRAQQSVRAADAGYRLALGALGSLIGVDELFEIEAPPALAPLEEGAELESLLDEAVASRLDLRAQKLAVQIADRGRMDAWMMFMPSLALSASASATSNVSGFINAPVTGALALTATVPLYDGGARYAALKESASRVREELLKVRQLEERIAGQVRGNLDDIALKKSAVALAREAAAVARQAADQAQALIEVGAATDLDVSDANLAVFAAEVDLARAELELEQSRLGLSYVVGQFPPTAGVQAPLLTDEEAEAARELLERSE